MLDASVFIGTSLDGFIARRDGSIDWLSSVPDGDDDYGYEAFMAGVDGLVMGRGTYETARGFGAWPYKKPVVVLSTTLEGTPVPEDLAGTVRFVNQPPAELVARLEAEGWRHAYIDGGKTIQSFLRAGLIRELIITRLPILIGSGLPLFGETGDDIRLEHIETHTYENGLVQSRYRVVR